MAEFNIDMEPYNAKLREALRPVKLLSIVAEGVSEVSNARKKHGPNDDLEDGTGPGRSILSAARITALSNRKFEDMVKSWVDRGMGEDRQHTRAGILFEEVVEAIASDNPADLRGELIQIIAMAADWVADLDAREV